MSRASYDVANELTSSQAVTGQTTYGYDLRGNRTQVTPPAPGTAVNLGYDQANRLKSYGSSASYGYNGDGLRMSKAVGATTSQEAWDLASSAVPTMVQDGTTSYVTGPGGLPLEQISGSTATYYHCDQLGSTRALTNQAGDVVETASYDAYGAPTTSGSSTPFGFAGQYTDAESGLVYLRVRYYDPTTGQFLSRDPAVALTRQPYSYSYDNPLNLTDPAGLGPFDWALPGGGTLAGGGAAACVFGGCEAAAVAAPFIFAAGLGAAIGFEIAPGVSKGLDAADPYLVGAASWVGSNWLHAKAGDQPMRQGKRANTAENADVERVCQDFGLDKRQRRQLHDELGRLRREGEPVTGYGGSGESQKTSASGRENTCVPE